MDRIAEILQGGDINIFYWINQAVRSSFGDWILPKFTQIGGAFSSVLCALSFLLSKSMFWHQVGINLALSLSVSHLIVQFLKRFVRRRRPYEVLNGVSTGSKLYKDASFPSGHSTAAFCMATVLSAAVPSFLFIFYSIALIVAFSRVYLGMHYPSDITIGAGIGIITAAFFIG